MGREGVVLVLGQGSPGCRRPVPPNPGLHREGTSARPLPPTHLHLTIKIFNSRVFPISPGPGTFIALSQFGELRSHKPSGTAKRKTSITPRDQFIQHIFAEFCYMSARFLE